MKANKIIITLLSIFALFLSSCHKGSMWGIKGEGGSVTEKRYLAAINGIDVSVDANVTYVQDSIYSIEINAQKNILAILETRVEGGMLVMDFRRNVWNYKTIHMTIHAPHLNRIHISGSGSITGLNKITENHLECDINGSGNISMASVSVQALDLQISGSGNLVINEGNCKSETLNVSGSGNIKTEFLESENANANISGSGMITLKCTESLKAKISGSGNISYRGNPAVNVDISGSGRLIHLD